MQAQAMVRCGVCRTRFGTVRELLDHSHTCEFRKLSHRLTPTTSGVRLSSAELSAKSPEKVVRRDERVTAGMVMTAPAVTVRQDATVWTAWGLLYGADYRHLVVVDYHRRPVGVLDEQTITREWPPGPAAPHRQRAYDLIPGGVPPHAKRDDDLATVAKAMLRADVDALPVVDDAGRLLGLVTTRELTEHVATCA